MVWKITRYLSVYKRYINVILTTLLIFSIVLKTLIECVNNYLIYYNIIIFILVLHYYYSIDKPETKSILFSL